MRNEAELIAIVNRLASIENDGDPSIASIEAAVPELGSLDWINRFGAGAWAAIASGLPTGTLEQLIKILIVAEREYDWLGGSVAAPIWLFRVYSERVGADSAGLAEWALRNRGPNTYIPFGISTSARSLQGWELQQRLYEERRVAQRLREEEAKDARKRRAGERIVRSLQRKEASRARHQTLLSCVKELCELDAFGRLSYIARHGDLPLEFVAQTLVADCIGVADCLDDETKEELAPQFRTVG